MIVVSKLLASIPGIVHGFGSLSEPLPEIIQSEWGRRPNWQQVHGAASAIAEYPGQNCGEVDALITGSPRLPVGVYTADCVPILLARRDGKKVAAVHAGWRGTRARILGALLSSLKANGEHLSDWVAAVGPAIGPCCYEVSQEIASDFEREFKLKGAVIRERYLDLPFINSQELLQNGVGDVDLIRACTRCSGLPDRPLFHSYRREGAAYREYSVIMIEDV